MTDSIGKSQAATEEALALKIGDKMEDGTVFAGMSPVTLKPMYVMPEDAPLVTHWNEAVKYAAQFEGHGHPKGAFRIPTDSELKILCSNQAEIGGFKGGPNYRGQLADLFYWSSTPTRPESAYVYAMRFDVPRFGWMRDSCAGSVRLVLK